MKTKQIIMVLLALMLAIPMHGQVELKKHSPELAGNQALIREWLDTVSISYVVTEKGKKFFVRDIRGHTSAVAASIPEEMTIADMEINGEYLYFCGTYDSNNTTYGMVGVLNIFNTFNWMQSYHIGLFDWTSDSLSGMIRMTKPQRVGSTWNNATSDIYVSVVGEIEHMDPTGHITKQTGVCEAFTDATFSPWKCGYYWCDDPDVVFTDITETDSFYVAVGHHATLGTTLIKRFKVPTPFVLGQRPFTKSSNIENHGNIEYVQDDVTEGEVLTVATKKDSFVVVNYYRNSTSAGSTVKLFDAKRPIATLAKTIKLQQNTIPSVSSAWKLREIQYDYLSGMTFVLQDMDYPINATVKSTMCEYDLWSTSSNGWFTIPGYSVYGMGCWSGAGFQVAGDAAGKLNYMRKRGGTTSSCETTTRHTYTVVSPNVDTLQRTEHGFGYNEDMISISRQARLRPIKIIYDCVR